jgi:hypothetical protein
MRISLDCVVGSHPRHSSLKAARLGAHDARVQYQYRTVIALGQAALDMGEVQADLGMSVQRKFTARFSSTTGKRVEH